MNFIYFLENKKKYLLKILEHSKKFLSEVCENNFSNLTSFKKKQNALLNLIHFSNLKIKKKGMGAPLLGKNDFIQKSKEEESSLIKKILHINQQIICTLEKEKNRKLYQIYDTVRSEQTMRKFKSTWVSKRGEQLDGKI